MKKLILFTLSLMCTFAHADTKSIINQEQAWKIVKQNVLYNKSENVNVYVSPSVIPPNSAIKTLGREEISPNVNSWLFFIDDIPFGNWSHPCRYIYVDCENGKIITHNHSMPPSGVGLKALIEQKTYTAVPLYDCKKMKEISYRSIVTNSGLKNYASTNNYAVIINGGVNDSLNYKRYWNDCAAIYSTLVYVYGYNKNHIYVIMSDGTNPAYDRHTNNGYDSSPLDLDGDGTNDIQYAATRTNVISVFNQLSNSLTSDNNLFVFTMDHGGRQGNNCFLCLWNNEKMYDYEFANYLSNINAGTINICMGQCNSGGFIDNITNSKYAIATACKYDEVSYSLCHGLEGYDAFVYYWIAAVTGTYPDGGTANADANNDGYISMREAFNFASSMDPTNEHPQFDFEPLGTDTRLNLFMEIPDGIIGNDLIASNATYTIQNLPSGATVQWSTSNSKLSLVSGQGTGTATFQKVSNGACTITAQVTLGTTTLSFTKDVWAGTPTAPTVTGWPHTNLFMENTEYDFVAHGNSQAQILEYQWTVVKGATLISGGSSSSASFMMNSPGPVSIMVRARNACGWGPYTNKSGGITDDNGLIPINSPGNNIVSIPLSGDGEYEIQLWNTNRMIRSTKTTKSSYDVDLSNLPSDLYIIKVLKDGQNFNQMKVKK